MRDIGELGGLGRKSRGILWRIQCVMEVRNHYIINQSFWRSIFLYIYSKKLQQFLLISHIRG